MKTFSDSEIKGFDKVDSHSVVIAGVAIVSSDSIKMKDPEKVKAKPSAAAGKGKKGAIEVSRGCSLFAINLFAVKLFSQSIITLHVAS